jgi:hypothetical protein
VNFSPKIRRAALALALAGASPALADPPGGTIGATSGSTLGIVLTLPTEIAGLSQLQDFVMPGWSGSGDLVVTQSLCVFTATRRYGVAAAGSGSGGAFALNDSTVPAPNAIAYEVQWAATAGAAGGTSLAPNVALTGLVTTATSTNCGGGPTATLIVRVPEANIVAAPAGGSAYIGSLTLTILPE